MGWRLHTTSLSSGVLKAWVDPSKKTPRTMHHCGKDTSMVADKTVTLTSKMKYGQVHLPATVMGAGLSGWPNQ